MKWRIVILVRGRDRLRKTICQIIMRDLELNDLSSYMTHDRILWRHLIQLVGNQKPMTVVVVVIV